MKGKCVQRISESKRKGFPLETAIKTSLTYNFKMNSKF